MPLIVIGIGVNSHSLHILLFLITSSLIKNDFKQFLNPADIFEYLHDGKCADCDVHCDNSVNEPVCIGREVEKNPNYFFTFTNECLMRFRNCGRHPDIKYEIKQKGICPTPEICKYDCNNDWQPICVAPENNNDAAFALTFHNECRLQYHNCMSTSCKLNFPRLF